MSPRASLPLSLLFLTFAIPTFAADGNRLTHLDNNNPYHVGRTSVRPITPQWVGEDGVEAVVILAIDDMRGHEKWEAFLRPVLRRLQRIDGRAPVSIMTCRIDPKDAHLQKWIKEGLSLETHTFDHPCPQEFVESVVDSEPGISIDWRELRGHHSQHPIIGVAVEWSSWRTPARYCPGWGGSDKIGRLWRAEAPMEPHREHQR